MPRTLRAPKLLAAAFLAAAPVLLFPLFSLYYYSLVAFHLSIWLAAADKGDPLTELETARRASRCGRAPLDPRPPHRGARPPPRSGRYRPPRPRRDPPARRPRRDRMRERAPGGAR